MDDAHWMAVFYHIILWEWIKTIPNNKKKQLKMSIHEYPGYFGSPGYPRVPQGTPLEAGDPLPSRRAWLGLRRAGPDGEDPIGHLWEESYYGSLSRWRPKHWSKNKAFIAICHRSRTFCFQKNKFHNLSASLFNTF
jgi:hypothetical protein